MKRWRRIVPAVVATAALPVLAGAGSCGILFDLWSWDEMTDQADRIDAYVEEGVQEIVGQGDRANIWLQRHVYAFEGSLGDAVAEVDDERVFRLVFDCDGPATCFADHWLEVPESIAIDMKLDQGTIELFALSGPITLELGDDVVVGGDVLSSTTFALDGQSLGDVRLTWVAAPERIDIVADDAAVALQVPAGSYVCELSGAGAVEVAPEIVCGDATATAVLHVDAGAGSVRVGPSPP